MTKKLYKLMNWADVEGIVYAEEDDPHRLLGPHVRGMNTMKRDILQRLFQRQRKQTVIPWKYGCRTDRSRKYVIPIVLDL